MVVEETVVAASDDVDDDGNDMRKQIKRTILATIRICQQVIFFADAVVGLSYGKVDTVVVVVVVK